MDLQFLNKGLEGKVLFIQQKPAPVKTTALDNCTRPVDERKWRAGLWNCRFQGPWNLPVDVRVQSRTLFPSSQPMS